MLDAAFLVVEVLSEGDVMSVVVEKLKEYAKNGVPNIWLIDPRLRLMWTYAPPMLVETEGELIATLDRSIELSRDEVFASKAKRPPQTDDVGLRYWAFDKSFPRILTASSTCFSAAM